MKLVLLILLMTAGLSACGGSEYPDCIGAVQGSSHTYREIGFTDHEGKALQQVASFASCDAVQRDGASTALRKEAEAIEVRSFPGYRPDQLIEVQVTEDAWSVLASETAPDELIRKIKKMGLLNAGEQ